MLCDVARHIAGVVVKVETEPTAPAQSRRMNAAILERICEVTGVDPTQCTSFDELIMVLGHYTQRRNWLCDIMPSRDPETRPV
jgi:hypothetical protein